MQHQVLARSEEHRWLLEWFHQPYVTMINEGRRVCAATTTRSERCAQQQTTKLKKHDGARSISSCPWQTSPSFSPRSNKPRNNFKRSNKHLKKRGASCRRTERPPWPMSSSRARVHRSVSRNNVGDTRFVDTTHHAHCLPCVAAGCSAVDTWSCAMRTTADRLASRHTRERHERNEEQHLCVSASS